MVDIIVTYILSEYDSFENKYIRTKHFKEYNWVDMNKMYKDVDILKTDNRIENIHIYSTKEVEGV